MIEPHLAGDGQVEGGQVRVSGDDLRVLAEGGVIDRSRIRVSLYPPPTGKMARTFGSRNPSFPNTFLNESRPEPEPEPIGDGPGEDQRIEDVEHAAEAGDGLGGVLALAVALDHRLHQVAELGDRGDDQPVAGGAWASRRSGCRASSGRSPRPSARRPRRRPGRRRPLRPSSWG